MPATFDKDPDAVLDYHVIWADWLGDNDTIASQTVIADSGITVDSSGINGSAVTIDGTEYAADTVVTIWLSGGTARSNYTVTSRVVTNESRMADRSFIVQIRER